MPFSVKLALLAAALVLASCSHGGPIVPGEIFLEIPFEDGAEGAGIDVISRKTRLVPTDEWERMRPYMLMIHAKYWTEIKKSWLKACRLVGPECNVQVESVDKVILALDAILKNVFPKGVPLNPAKTAEQSLLEETGLRPED